jgi:hypothetical protein
MALFDDLGLGTVETLSLSGFEKWVTLGINIILSTIVGGLVLLVVAGIINKKYHEGAETGNAFLMALVVNVVNFAGIVGLLGAVLPIPALTMFLPLLVWIVLAKFFFSEMSFVHILIVAVTGYLLSILLVPQLTVILRGFMPV